MSEQDKDWDQLARQWQETELPEADVNWLQANVRRKRRGLFLANLLDAVGTVAVLVFVAWIIGPKPGGEDLGLLLAVIVMLAIVWALTLWNRRDGWRTQVDDLRESLAWNLERCRRQRRSIVFAWAVFVAQLVIVAVYLRLFSEPASPGQYWNAALLVSGFSIGMVVWSWLYARRISKEEQRLRELQKNFNGDV